jgi:hypothetical protein
MGKEGMVSTITRQNNQSCEIKSREEKKAEKETEEEVAV